MTGGRPDVEGWVEPGFEAVRDAFVANFAEHGEVGAAVSAYVDGRPVLDLWGGVADPATGRRWSDDTVVPVFSSTKGVTAVGANLAIERGLLDPEATVATYWPEFAAAGKESITVGQVLSHQAGLPLVEGDFTLDEVLSWEPVVSALAAQAPLWPPGSQHGYHMRSYGWLVGELLRRVTGVSPGQFLRRRAWPIRSACSSGSGCPKTWSRGWPASSHRRTVCVSCWHRSASRCCWLGSSRTPSELVRLRRDVEHPSAPRVRTAVVERHR